MPTNNNNNNGPVHRNRAARNPPRNLRPQRFSALLKSIYTDLTNPANFSSPYILYRAAKKINQNIKYKDVEAWIESQPSYTLYRKKKDSFPRRKVLARGIAYQYQADLVDYSALKRDNSGHTFVLTIIDIFSRFALAIPIKSKGGKNVSAALQRAFQSMKTPKMLQTDLGKEFYNQNVRKLLTRLKVVHFSTDQPLKAQIVERFNRTLRQTIKQYMAHNQTLRYVDKLPDFLKGYNSRVHSAIKPYSPDKVTAQNEREVHNLQYGEYLALQKKRHKYKIGDVVRRASSKNAFTKSYKYKTFSDKLYKIIDVLQTHPPTYKIKELRSGNLVDGCQYQQQLQRVRDNN